MEYSQDTVKAQARRTVESMLSLCMQHLELSVTSPREGPNETRGLVSL